MFGLQAWYFPGSGVAKKTHYLYLFIKLLIKWHSGISTCLPTYLPSYLCVCIYVYMYNLMHGGNVHIYKYIQKTYTVHIHVYCIHIENRHMYDIFLPYIHMPYIAPLENKCWTAGSAAPGCRFCSAMPKIWWFNMV